MSGLLPKDIRDRIQRKIWDKADELDWARLSDLDRAGWYENWSKDKEIGSALAHFMDARKVRVYIKDSLFKPYHRARSQSDERKVFTALHIDPDTAFSKSFTKPHGRRLVDGRVICWGSSRDWKSVLMSAFERGWGAGTAGQAVVLIETGKTMDLTLRAMVHDIGQRLGLNAVVWID
ncbi:conserved hypothetical protein [Mesorhizobium plurifarium]|uniref:Uncharacterized protein n=1 Tax=Mesorhizobium plurifarium TaxID=69974 RepID=A0A090DWT4_MESPL|nr:conserved hypothetical protein [Mesorhizobium plurifarium]